MRNEYKMMLAGFAAGAVVGVVALGSVGATVGVMNGLRGDRLVAPVKPTLTYQDVDPAAVVSHVELIGPKGAVVEFRDPAGNLVYRSDPVNNTTVVSKNVIIPSFTVRERAGDLAEMTLVNTPEPAKN